MKSIRTAIVIGVLAALVGAPAAWADGKNPSIEQYVEQIPTSKGSKPAGGPATKVSKLPQRVENTIRTETGSATAAKALEEVATSARFGATKKVVVKKVAARKQLEKQLRIKDVEKAKAIPAAIGAVSESGNGRLLALVILMAVMAAGAVALAALRRVGSRR
jgi:hypothetical protein